MDKIECICLLKEFLGTSADKAILRNKEGQGHVAKWVHLKFVIHYNFDCMMMCFPAVLKMAWDEILRWFLVESVWTAKSCTHDFKYSTCRHMILVSTLTWLKRFLDERLVLICYSNLRKAVSI